MNERNCTTYQEDLLGLIDEALEPAVEAELRAHLEQCPACAKEYRWLNATCAELESLGDEWARQAPPVDLLDGILEMVARVKEVRPRPVPFTPQPARRRMRWTGWASLAAGLAAAAVIVYFMIVSPGEKASERQVEAQRTPVLNAKSNRPSHLAANTQTRLSQTAMKELQKFFDPKRTPVPDATADGSASKPAMEQAMSITLAQLLELRKQAIDSPDARTRLSLWATIADAKARELAKDSGVSIEAKVGLVNSLPPEEAETVLLAAIESFPNDPYLRKELADVYSSQPGNEAKAAAQLQELSRLDPDNAYASFKLASNMFTQGDVDAARLLLDQAQALDHMDAYTQSAAKYYESALEASGADTGVAEAAAALSAGTNEYGNLVALGNGLIQAGRNVEQQGDAALAEQILEAVQGLGAMVVRNAVFSAEWLAGLDIQSSAISARGETAAAESSPETLSSLAQEMQDLVAAYNELAAYYRSFDAFFSGGVTDALFLLLASLILQNGDLNALDLLPQQ